ncbi:MAG: DUF547 domain-containing protein [Micavibrio sp.]|nr:MAG: DUF547 domain-containing protein [Micavibrio sp.]
MTFLKYRKAFALVSVFLLVLFHPAPAFAEEEYNRFLSLYDGLLQDYVRPAKENGISFNGVDYDSWAKDARHKQALSLITAAPPQSDKMDYWINLYNFLTIDLIVREGERENIRNLGGFFRNPWKRHKWEIAGRDYTLHEIEHEILRPMGDARIHFAINCAALSCPDLRDEVYRAEKLDLQLDEQTRLTLNNNSKGLRRDGNTVFLSKVMDWFREDYNDGDLVSWLNPYLEPPLDTNTRTRFLPYDWSLNNAAP